MSYATALAAADTWRDRIELELCMAGAERRDAWLRPAEVDGYAFVPLATAQDIAAEAAAMRNCLVTLGPRLAHNIRRLWSIRRGGKAVATLELSVSRHDQLVEIGQIRGPGNAPISREVGWAARRWVADHDLSQIAPGRSRWGEARLCRQTWVTLWRPYWLAKRRLPPWLPLAPSFAALSAL